MAKTNPETIILRSNAEGIPTKEGTVAAGVTITPGRFVVDAGGTVRLANNADSPVTVRDTRAIALEDDLQGNGIDDDYAAASRIRFRDLLPGEEAYAWLASGQNVAAGARLQLTVNGELTALVSGTALAQTIEAKNASGGAARVRVRML